MANHILDLIGHKFGRLKVEAFAGRNKYGMSVWSCVCECGNTGVYVGTHLRQAKVQSCGCLRRELLSERQTKHGMTITNMPEYRSWSHMIRRCTNPKDARYADYGGRGIKVCDRWLNDVHAFFADMGPRPSPKHSIDRIDNSGNYEPGNCRWATPPEQIRNTRRNKLYTHDGVSLGLTDWAAKTGIQLYKLRYYVERRKMSISDALASADPSEGRGQWHKRGKRVATAA